ncbi:MAG: phage tail protein [Sporomusa sp.]
MPGAFIEKGTSSGRLHVLQREGKDRYPLHIKYGPSVPQMIGAEKTRTFIEDRAYGVLANRLDYEINRLLTKKR